MAQTATAFCASLLRLAFSAAAQTNTVIIDDDFTTLNAGLWEAATNGPAQVGAPHRTTPDQLGGRSVLLLESTLNGPQRRGYLSTPPFRMRHALIEVDFSPLAGEGAPLEVWLIFPYGDLFMALSLFAAEPGSNITRLQTAGAVLTYGAPPLWRHGEWYRCVLDVRGRSVRASILDERGATVWTQTYPWSLCSFAPDWGVGFVQFRDEGSGTALAAIDRFRVTLRCSTDLDEDGRLTPADFLAFIAAWNAGECSADMDTDCSRTINDFVLFQRSYAAGCL